MRRLNCAIYTRKSTDEGLEQEFNSLQAQREACEAYVLSQAGEGWGLVRSAYDDGGYSGGNLQRPALQRLLADVEAGRIDVVVVYKVDRLTRALSDFARIVDVLDRAGASFVSVTQAFNTTTSMGRLTLNVLLSFAQFERELTSERIRDKIAASKSKGMWMGGMIPLGYDVENRRLVPNAAERQLICRVFHRYLELGSVRELANELQAEDARSKCWVSASGRRMGGRSISRGALFHILKNRIYVGEVEHKGRISQGLHEPLVERTVFDAVQTKLHAQSARKRRGLSKLPKSPLEGLLFNESGELLSPSFGYGKQGRRYRYYVALGLQKGLRTRQRNDVTERISAVTAEQFLVGELQRLTGGPLSGDALRSLVKRVELHLEETQIVVDADVFFGGRNRQLAYQRQLSRLGPGEYMAWEREDVGTLRICVPRRVPVRGGRTVISGQAAGQYRRPCPAIVQALRSAHALLRDHSASPLAKASELAKAKAPPTQHGRQLAKLAFLAPDIQRRLLTGDHSPRLRLRTLLRAEIPLCWTDQRGWFEQVAA